MEVMSVFSVSLITLLVYTWVPGRVDAVVESSGEPSLAGFTGWADYKRAWEEEDQLRAERMYPFMARFGDTQLYYPSGGVSLPIGFQFYAVKYNSIFISKDGHFRFSTLSTAPESQYSEQLLPNPLYPNPREGDDPPIAAVFFAPHKYKTSKARSEGRLNYREMRMSAGDSAKERVDSGQLEELSAHVQQAVVGADYFQATHGVIATWENFTFEGVFVPDGDIYPKNTYQMVLLTDDVETYVIFNYYDVTWAGSSSMGCNTRTGLRSDDSPNCRGAQIGFNVGEGRHFWNIPYSKSLSVVDLDMTELKGSNVRGRFFYKVSDAFIVRGGCTNDLKIAGPSWPLAINPTSGSMFGGYDVNISAPCFGTGERIQCKFGDMVTDGVYDGNVMKARCPAPMMTSVGRVNVSVSTDGGRGYPFSTLLTVGIMGYTPAGVQVENTGGDWLNVNRFDLKWDPKAITWRDVQTVDVFLYGYRETAIQDSGTWKLLRTLASNYQNQGFYTVNPGSHQCGEGVDAKTDCTQYSMGVFLVAIANSDPGASPTALWSEPVPLGWFIKTAAPKYLGTNWAHEMCRHWHGDDIKLDQWEAGLPLCPCTLGQALSDWGRFVTDIYCHQGAGARADNCQLHKGAVHCVISSQYTAKGAGSHCCYDSSGDLMYSGDTQYGSTPDKSHPWGMPPYGRSPNVPTLSNWFWDIAPRYTCCVWQDSDYDCFNLYVSRRTTPSCQPYQPPGIGVVFGDPHVRTFDGVVYTYNGKGEYWLLHANQVVMAGKQLEFCLQGRFEQPKTPSGLLPKATTMTSVSMQEVVSEVPGSRVEIQRNNYAPYDRLLLMYVNGQLLDFRDPNVWRQDFPDFFIINNDPMATKVVHGNFTVVFRVSGVGVQVAHKYGLIHVIAVIPPEFWGKTEGLMGAWDGISDNDIQPRGGGQAVPPEDTKRIHDMVGYTWQIGESESRFMYWARLNRDYYADGAFTPEFTPTFPSNGSGGVTAGQVTAVCGTNVPCQYDYMVTLVKQVALDTLEVQAWAQQQAQEARTVATCGWLDIPSAIKRQPLKYTPGSTVYIDGCRSGFKLEGTTRYTCVAQGSSAQWSPAVNTKCVDLTDVREAQTQLAIAAGVPAGIVLLLIIIGITGLLCYLSRKRRERKEKENPPDELMHMPRGDFHASDIRPEDVVITKPPKKKPRPDKRNNQSRSQDDLSLYGCPKIPSKPMSSSMDNLDKDVSMSSSGKDTIDLNSTLQSGTSSQKPQRPYNYPRNTDTIQDRRRAPYQYRSHAKDDFTPEERALIEARTRQYND